MEKENTHVNGKRDTRVMVMEKKDTNIDDSPEQNSKMRIHTTILDLNDDCLLQVYKNLDLLDLTAVADVCSHLRRTAKDYFQLSKFRDLNFLLVDRCGDITVNQLISETSKVLRSFGAFITGFSGKNEWFTRRNSWLNIDGLNEESIAKYWRECVRLLAKYCGENLVELRLYRFEMTKEVVLSPLFKRLHILELDYCRGSGQLLETLPMSCPQLRELYVRRMDLQHRELNHRFEKLTKLSLEYCNVQPNNIKEFLKQSPQLKEFAIRFRPRSDPRIFEYIGESAPEGIEVLDVHFTRANGILPTAYISNPKCFDRVE